jgi:hypothetical protein
MSVAGIDIGFNEVKAKANNNRSTRFPAEVGTPQHATFSLDEAKHDSLVLTLADESVWQVGHTALQSDYSAGRRDPQWVFSPSYRILLAASLSELYHTTTTTKVVTGLPLEHYTELSEPIRKVFLGEHRFKREGRRWQTVTIEDVFVITQPYGTLLDLALSDTGSILNNAFATQTVGVADIGGATFNLLAAQALEEIGHWTIGDDLGLLKALETIGRDIRRDHPGLKPKPREVAQWVANGTFSYKGEDVDITPYTDKHLTPVAQVVLNRMTEAWPEPGRYAALALTGGGSLALEHMLLEYMNEVYAHITMPDDPVFSNVSGYLKLARRLWG